MTERRWRTLATLVLIAALAYFFVRGPFSPAKPKRLWDYAVFASAAELWVRGEDPYDNERVASNWEAAPPGLSIERDVRWVRSNAPPTTLVVLAPFRLFGRTGGGIVYLIVTSTLIAIAAWRVGQWGGIARRTAWRLYAAGLLASTPLLLGLPSGNPVMLCAPLTLLAFERGRRAGGPWAGAMLGVAAAAKVQLGVPMILLAFVWRPYRRDAIVATAMLAAIATVGVARLTFAGIDWRAGLMARVAETNGPGGMNDFGNPKSTLEDHLELQARLYRVIGNRAITNGITWAIVGVAGLFFLQTLHRRQTMSSMERPERIDDPMIFGAAAALSLLVIYHRTYDALLLLPLISASIGGLCGADQPSRKTCIAILLLSVAFCVPIGIETLAQRYAPIRALQTTFLYRTFVFAPRSWALPPIACLALYHLWKAGRPTSFPAISPEKSPPQTQET